MTDETLFSRLDSLSKEEKIYIIDYLKRQLEEYELPVTIFDNKYLSALEAIVKYLREELGIKFVKISKLLNRSNKTIWTTYHIAKKKMPRRLIIKDSEIYIPLLIFSNRRISVLENITEYLKSRNLSYSEIARLLNRNYRTIVTVYNRARKKREKIAKKSQT